jgi:DUF1680 family protein
LDRTYFDPLSEGQNVLSNHHAYSFCNALSSAMQAYIADASEKHFRAASNAFQMISANQSFATGGWGPNESFVEPGKGKLYDSLNETHRGFETPCGSYAHFKLTRYLLRVTREGRYGDSMEQVLYNTVLGAKRLQPDGNAFYYSDYHLPGSKTYFPDKWPCCSGTLPQVAADYRILIFFRDGNDLLVNLYLPSTVHWVNDDGAQLSLTQSGSYPTDSNIAMQLRASRPSEFVLRLRVPAWSTASATAIGVNGEAAAISMDRGFASIRRRWKDGDRIDLHVPLRLRLEPVDPEHSGTVALMRGPLVLFALADTPPRITREQLLAASPGREQATWRADTRSGSLLFRPFTAITNEPYLTYLTTES